MYDPLTFNPSQQEVSMKDRLASKLDNREKVEYGLEPVTPEVPLMVLVAAKAKRRK